MPTADEPKGDDMLEFMRAGGFLMWPLLILGLGANVAMARAAFTDGDTLGPRQALHAVLTASLGWGLLGFVVVTRHAVDATQAELILGYGEAACPAVLGLLLYAAGELIGAVPFGQVGRRDA